MFGNETLFEVDYGNVQEAQAAIRHSRHVPCPRVIMQSVLALTFFCLALRTIPSDEAAKIRRFLGL